MKKKITVLAMILAIIIGVTARQASAHHNTVSCYAPGVWLIVNSEADKAESFTTNEGHSGDIPAGGSTTVEFSGTSLIVYGTWTNGATNTATGTGDCTDVPETTEPTETTEVTETTEPTETTEVTETTEPTETTEVTETTEGSDTTVPSDSTEPPVETTEPTETTETPTASTEPPESTEPVPPTVPTETTVPGTTPVPSDTSTQGTLPETGAETLSMMYVAGLLMVLGLVCLMVVAKKNEERKLAEQQVD